MGYSWRHVDGVFIDRMFGDLCVVEVARQDGEGEGLHLGAGKGFSQEIAQERALSESYEREAFERLAGTRLSARARDLTGTVLMPQDLLGLKMPQYEGLPFRECDRDDVMMWTAGLNCTTAERCYVPEELISSVATPPGRLPLGRVTSNGTACHPAAAVAALNAALEVLERHEYLMTWLTGRVVPVADFSTHPDAETRALYAAMKQSGLSVRLLCLSAEESLGQVCLALVTPCSPVRSNSALYLSLGLGASLGLDSAATSALMEACQMVSFMGRALSQDHFRLRANELIANPLRVRDSFENALLYSQREMAETMEGWFQTAGLRPWTSARGKEEIALTDLFVGRSVYQLDLTPPAARKARHRVIKVLVPGTLPLYSHPAECPMAFLPTGTLSERIAAPPPVA